MHVRMTTSRYDSQHTSQLLTSPSICRQYASATVRPSPSPHTARCTPHLVACTSRPNKLVANPLDISSLRTCLDTGPFTLAQIVKVDGGLSRLAATGKSSWRKGV
jgi:hypothetical protein